MAQKKACWSLPTQHNIEGTALQRQDATAGSAEAFSAAAMPGLPLPDVLSDLGHGPGGALPAVVRDSEIPRVSENPQGLARLTTAEGVL